jgi:hypothetical protein
LLGGFILPCFLDDNDRCVLCCAHFIDVACIDR